MSIHRHLSHGVAIGLIALLPAGCETVPPTPEPVAPPPEPASPAPPPPPDLDLLLRQARVAYDAHRLTTPAENSAYELYREVLRLDPDNDAARRGLEKIVERYIQFALDAVDRRQFSRARTMLKRARFVDANHPAIAPTEEQLQLIENARRDRETIDRQLLEQRGARLALRLQKLGQRAAAANCRVQINAASDADGRWIYRQINKGSPGARVRARLQITAPPSVELICPGRSEQFDGAASNHS